MQNQIRLWIADKDFVWYIQSTVIYHDIHVEYACTNKVIDICAAKVVHKMYKTTSMGTAHWAARALPIIGQPKLAKITVN